MKSLAEMLCAKNKIDKVFFVACGGSYAAMYPAKYFLEQESKALTRISLMNAGEFVCEPPAVLDSNTLVILISHAGETPETIEAAKLAKAKQCHTVGFTFEAESSLGQCVDYVITYEFARSGYYVKHNTRNYKAVKVLELCFELMRLLENWEYYDDATASLAKFDEIVQKGRKKAEEPAEKFAARFSNETFIYTLGASATWSSAYIESLCILMEMQWIHSACIHSGEFFHGPFEVVEKGVPFIVFTGIGEGKKMDKRLLSFLERYEAKTEVIDAEFYGANQFDLHNAKYFAPLLLTNVIDVYNTKLSEKRNHPMLTRRYMWKVSY